MCGCVSRLCLHSLSMSLVHTFHSSTFNLKRLNKIQWNIHNEPHINKSTAIFSPNQINCDVKFGMRLPCEQTVTILFHCWSFDWSRFHFVLFVCVLNACTKPIDESPHLICTFKQHSVSKLSKCNQFVFCFKARINARLWVWVKCVSE